jgi:hypothetical protein
MIQQVPAFQVGQLVFPTLQEAQKSELIALFDGAVDGNLEFSKEGAKAFAEAVVSHTDEVVAILTCTPKSKGPRKPRSDIGKKRAPKNEIGTET